MNKNTTIAMRITSEKKEKLISLAKSMKKNLTELLIESAENYVDLMRDSIQLVEGYSMLNKFFNKLSETDDVIKDYDKLVELIEKNLNVEKLKELNKVLKLE